MSKKASVSGHATRTGTPPKKAVLQEQTFTKAFIVPAELGDKILQMFGELPRRLSPMVDPIHMEFQNCHRADVTLRPPAESAEEPTENVVEE